MEKNQQELTPLFSSLDAQSSEVIIAISSVEENIRKLYEASKMGCVQTLKTLIQEDPDLIQKVLTSTSNIDSPLLHVSVSHGHFEFTRLLLDYKPELAAEVDTLQRTPLHLASEYGYMEIIRVLLEKNTSACLVRDLNGLIPLHYAVIGGQIKIMQELINARPQSVWMKLNNGRTILHLCVEGNHLEAMKLFVETFAIRDKEVLNAMDDAGNTILDLSLTLRQIEMVGYLLSIPEVKTRTSQANFDASNATKETPKLQKTNTRNPKRQRREFASSSTKKMAAGRWKEWRKKLKYKGDWVQEVQGTMMLVATVIATMTFQAGINPPGGVWQQDTPFNVTQTDRFYHYWNSYDSISDNATIVDLAGTAIMASLQREFYMVYLMANTVSFLASVSVILLIISRFPLKNRICSWLLALAMGAAVLFLALAYLIGVRMVNLHVIIEDIDASFGYVVAIFSWYGMVLLVGLCYVVRFLVWVVKRLFRTFISKLKSPQLQ